MLAACYTRANPGVMEYEPYTSYAYAAADTTTKAKVATPRGSLPSLLTIHSELAATLPSPLTSTSPPQFYSIKLACRCPLLSPIFPLIPFPTDCHLPCNNTFYPLHNQLVSLMFSFCLQACHHLPNSQKTFSLLFNDCLFSLFPLVLGVCCLFLLP